MAKSKSRALKHRQVPKDSRAVAMLEYTGWVPFACAIAALITIAFAGITWVTSPYWGKVQEVRDAMLDFRKSGKPLYAYLEYGGDREYYLATAADKREPK